MVACVQCNKEVWVKPCKQSSQTFCSRKCSGDWRREHPEVNYQWQGGDVPTTCATCGREFLAPRKEVNRGYGRFCSRQCAGAGKASKVAKVCELCQAEFRVAKHKEGSARFCSRQCKKLSQIKKRTAAEIATRRLRMRMSVAIWHALKKGKQGCSWEKLTGYTVHDLRRHLESRFTEGMTWDNMGEWHIDHIRPCASFTYTCPEDPEFQECWALANLQPLWAKENLQKWAKWGGPG